MLHLLSDHAREWAAFILAAHPFLQLFDPRTFSFELGRLKQEPGTFCHFLRMIERDPTRCLFIDDSQANIAAAAAAGIRGVRFTDAADLTSQLSETGILP